MAKNTKLNLITDSAMVKAAKKLYNAVRKYAPYKKIKDAVFISRVEGRGTSRFITVGVDTKSVPYARAFDKGSGIHGKLGHKYTITARNAPLLVFRLRDGKIFSGKSVQHPGVAGVNYTERALNESRNGIREELKKDVANNLRLYLRAEFSDFGK